MQGTRRRLALVTLASLLLLGGCQSSRGLYYWGGYESGLYGYYKNPEQLATLSKQVLQTIESSRGRVPPGLYAEYGTLLWQQGKTDQAISYYTKERDLWPESRPLMDTMIKNLTLKSKTARPMAEKDH